jgi:hypothetical protein
VYLFESNVSDLYYESAIKLVTDKKNANGLLEVDTSATAFTSQFTYPVAKDPALAPTTLTDASASTMTAALKDVRYITSTHPQAQITEAIFSDQYAQTFATVYG